METLEGPGRRLLVYLEVAGLEAEAFEEHRESHEDRQQVRCRLGAKVAGGS